MPVPTVARAMVSSDESDGSSRQRLRLANASRRTVCAFRLQPLAGCARAYFPFGSGMLELQWWSFRFPGSRQRGLTEMR